MVNTRHQTPQGQSIAKHETLLQNIQVEQLNVTQRGPMAPAAKRPFLLFVEETSSLPVC